ncbi:MAG: hypothetical protein QXT26_05935 [Thermoproteota archaeon]
MTIKVTVGTVGIMVLRPNPYRTGYRITMPTTSLYPANTGRVHIGEGYIPTPDPNAPDCGDIITQGISIEVSEAYPNDPSVFKGEIYAIANTADQVILVDEYTRYVPEGESKHA